ncbi:hypothetical protein AC578_8352 [Pseudocercospora eumusae]|uniref:Uncharacterized protein n=1 Tax=Pseudocercospora eumusae TaxID=321146 RepID=A0A139HRY3_9PEZI|nr:hypothetical protein AC578_8352 [Pseudocercospora eumusae]
MSEAQFAPSSTLDEAMLIAAVLKVDGRGCCGCEASIIARTAIVNVRMMYAVWRDIENFLEVGPSLYQSDRKTLEKGQDHSQYQIIEDDKYRRARHPSLELCESGKLRFRQKANELTSLACTDELSGKINKEGSSLRSCVYGLPSNN